jgi:hypothetical protein
MTTLREAAQQALEALHEIGWSNNTRWQSDRAATVIPALRAALAEPVQEPPCATRECMPSQCPNCTSIEAQNTELDRKLAELEAALRAQS